ncbi:MAG: hypothetical protein QMC80_03260, partial [Thermoplasmatales archaeon]|nr:hypothetical protein [Thermoplasmatales archaeon]
MIKCLKKILCVLLVIGMILSSMTMLTGNVLADEENGEEMPVVSLNPDVAVDGYTHIVWQENLTGNIEIFYSNSKNGNYREKLEKAINDVGFLVENTKNNDAVKELKKSLGKLNTAKTNYYASDFEKSFKNTENAVDHLMKAK